MSNCIDGESFVKSDSLDMKYVIKIFYEMQDYRKTKVLPSYIKVMAMMNGAKSEKEQIEFFAEAYFYACERIVTVYVPPIE